MLDDLEIYFGTSVIMHFPTSRAYSGKIYTDLYQFRTFFRFLPLFQKGDCSLGLSTTDLATLIHLKATQHPCSETFYLSRISSLMESGHAGSRPLSS